MVKTRKYFRKHCKTYKKHKKNGNSNRKYKKSLMRKNKKLIKKSSKYSAKGGSNYPYLPQGLVNTFWNAKHGISKMINDYKGVPSSPGIFPTQQPDLIHIDRPQTYIPDLKALNNSADLKVANLLKN